MMHTLSRKDDKIPKIIMMIMMLCTQAACHVVITKLPAIKWMMHFVLASLLLLLIFNHAQR
jgi:hypothetical protein